MVGWTWMLVMSFLAHTALLSKNRGLHCSAISHLQTGSAIESRHTARKKQNNWESLFVWCFFLFKIIWLERYPVVNCRTFPVGRLINVLSPMTLKCIVYQIQTESYEHMTYESCDILNLQNDHLICLNLCTGMPFVLILDY